jgi:hypothetical protein
MSTLTTANSSMSLQVRNLFPVPQIIKGYATDDSFAVDDVDPAETYMGVDGQLSGGYVPYSTKLTMTLQADSASTAMFETVLAAQVAAKELYIWDGVIIIQGTGQKYNFTKGFLRTASPMPGSKKVLQPRKFMIEFEQCTPSPA